MRKINIDKYREVTIKGDICYNGQGRPREQAKIIAKIQNVQLYCYAKETEMENIEKDVIEELDTKYLKCDNIDVQNLGYATSPLDVALETAFSLMVDGETASIDITLPWDYALSFDHVKLKDQAKSLTLICSCIAHLKLVDGGKPIYEFTQEEKLAIASEYKKIGNSLYKLGTLAKHACAFYKFCDSIKWLAMIENKEGNAILHDITTLRCQCYNNISLYHLQQQRYSLAVAALSTVLNIEGKNVKALYRRAIANTELQNYELAVSDVQAALVLEPCNKALKQQEEVIKKRQAAVSGVYAAAMKKYFS